VVEVALTEQRRLGQDLHDNCGQELTALGLLADGLVESLSKSAPADVEVASKIEQALKRVLRQVRNISRGLVQVDVDPAGLPGALADLASRLSATSTGVRCVFHGDKGVHIEDSTKATHLYHIAQEACTNALKHARARTVEVRLHALPHETPSASVLSAAGNAPGRGEGGVILQVRDDGLGIPKDAPEGLGLRIMRNRASVIRARLTIKAVKPQGTVVACIFKERCNVPDQD
jgi:signal transduction histidine kinase